MMRYILSITMIGVVIFIAAQTRAKAIDERIYIVPAGEVDTGVLKAIKERLPENLPIAVTVEISRGEKIPEAAYDTSRRQYNAETIVDDISGRITLLRSMETSLIVTDVDLYAPGLNFVFGIADAPKKTCVISVSRLRNEFYGLKPDKKLFLERVLKEAVHELGHAWGLEHCPNRRCVMFFSNSLEDTDRKRGTFCRGCQRKAHNRYYSPLFKGKLF